METKNEKIKRNIKKFDVVILLKLELKWLILNPIS